MSQHASELWKSTGVVPGRVDLHQPVPDGVVSRWCQNAGDQTTAVVVGDGDPIELPAETLKTLHKVIHALASGTEPIVTTTEAADFLGVSRPYLTRLLKAGKTCHCKTGDSHLVSASALREFKTKRDRELDQLDRLAAAEEVMGLR